MVRLCAPQPAAPSRIAQQGDVTTAIRLRIRRFWTGTTAGCSCNSCARTSGRQAALQANALP
ncbi:hypothetical protein [uncultured Sphingomonas sp.]|uniref:hypothetical protein n=1 Tax=uncultured Sphingomonas sp. TaxID=158754 RepID=UPI003748588A